ncbi:MAG: tetratricopeptide repeat protein [Pyrinomonadaceae bacterium]|nr:tetratricopeptide repeat protein [Pyrinomonadaceae bacterium]
MRNTAQISLLTLLVLSFCAGVSAQDLLPGLVRRIKPSAVAIETFDANGKSLSRGSGFFVAVDRVVTNRHVIDKSSSVEIHLSNGEKYKAKGILAVDREGDLALLEVKVPKIYARPLPIVATSPEEGESIVVIGNPYGLEGSVSNGIVSAVREIPGYGRIIQITAPISPGSSGSPVVNMRGQVIGVATLQAEEGQSLNFAVPSERISRLRVGNVREFSAVSREASLNKRAIAEQLYSKGLQLLSNDDFSRALPYFTEAVKSDPNYAEAWYQVGFSHGMLGNHEEALEASERAASLRPEWAETWVNIGASSFALEDFEGAADAYNKAAKLDDSNAELQYALGLSYNRLGRISDEILAYRRAVNLRPDHADALELLGSAYMQQRRYKRAISTFESLQAYRIDAKSYNYLGEAYLAQGKENKSVEAFLNAVSMDAAFDEARYNLARAYLKKGDRNLAQIQYEILKANGSDWADKLLSLLDP